MIWQTGPFGKDFSPLIREAFIVFFFFLVQYIHGLK